MATPAEIAAALKVVPNWEAIFTMQTGKSPKELGITNPVDADQALQMIQQARKAQPPTMQPNTAPQTGTGMNGSTPPALGG